LKVCNRCLADETQVTFSKRTLRCRPCSKEIWEENRRLEGNDPLAVRRNAKAVKRYGHAGAAFYIEKFAEQKGLCKMCNKPETLVSNGRLENLSIDHCHITGVLRGLLCRRCNTAIGYLNDDPVLVDRAAAYLRGELD
jgi:hypothetical protein